MKKILLLFLVLLAIFVTTGCEDDTISEDDGQKYTWWQGTDGTKLWLLDNECYLSRDDKKLNNVCEFTYNAHETGASVITICNSYGTDCDKNEISINRHESGDEIYTAYGTFYYKGTVKH